MANTLGIYFGPKVICIVEAKGRKILNYIKIPMASLVQDQLEEKVPEEVKLATVFTEELKKNNISAKEAILSVSGKDLVVRSFELPMLPSAELPAAVNFEAKKYLPFKAEELVSAYQAELDRKTKKYTILYLGIRKEILDKYMSILKEVGIKVVNLDYSAFSVLRFLRLTGQGNKGIVGVVSLDPQEEDEVNFMVLENGFPVFTRDITISGDQERQAAASEAPTGTSELINEKLKNEIKISLDYYSRKFPLKKISNVYFVSDENYRYDLEYFMKELELTAQFVDAYKYIGKAQFFSLSYIKAYGSSLTRVVSSGVKLNLFAPRPQVPVKISKKDKPVIDLLGIVTGLKLDFRFLVLALIIYGGVYAYGLYRTYPVRREIASLIVARPKAESASGNESLEELDSKETEYKNKIKAMDKLIKEQFNLTPVLEAIARSIPDDVWITDFNFQKSEGNRQDISMNGFAYVDDNAKELQLIDDFLNKLKENKEFQKYFKDTKILSLQQQQLGQVKVSSFAISCKTGK